MERSLRLTAPARDDGLLAHPWLPGAAVFLLSLPLLAVAPLNGDAGEQILAALQGGVRHPPGFVLQSLADRLFILLPLPHPATRLALPNLVAHAATVVALGCALRSAGVHAPPRTLAALVYGFFPPTWAMGVQVEVFAGAFLLSALVLAQAAALATRTAYSARDAVGVGLLVAAAAGQHPITVLTAPAFLASAWLLLRPAAGRARRLAQMAVPFLAGVAFCAWGMLQLRRGVAPPDWGNLQDLGDVAGHVLRQEYGTLTLSSVAPGASPLSGLEVLGGALGGAWGVVAAAACCVVGAVVAWRRSRVLAVAVAGTLVLALVFLAAAQLPGRDDDKAEALERLLGAAAVPGALLAGLALDAAWRAVGARWRLPGVLAAAAAPVLLAVHAVPKVDASRDQTLTVHARYLGAMLPAEAFWVSDQDTDVLWGAELPDGTRRFPVAEGLLGTSWYLDSALPVVEPRLHAPPQGTLKGLVRGVLAAGHVVARPSEGPWAAPDVHAEVRGPLVLLTRAPRPLVTEQSLRGALVLCQLLPALEGGPRAQHPLNRHLWRTWARAVDAAAQWLDGEARVEPALTAHALARALEQADASAPWKDLCPRLTQQLSAPVPPR
ncbi:MAG: DUF2723 domain-containing protein [Deltaproteobacteria bacterium]|nr:DUF2723 domain-containing protein [Deltaproteobacteria bacterium]